MEVQSGRLFHKIGKILPKEYVKSFPLFLFISIRNLVLDGRIAERGVQKGRVGFEGDL